VWRPGFEAWQRAEDVKEVAATFSPPPFRPDASSGQETTARAAVNAPHVPAAASELSGIGGWLVLLAIGQVLGPLRFMASAAQYYVSIDKELVQNFPIAFVGEGLLNATLAGLYIYTAILFFRKSKRFPRFCIYEFLATIFVLPVNAVWVAVTIGMMSGQPVGELLQGAFEPSEIGQMIAAVIGGCIWIPYLLKSRRIANTFVE
jgi:hypothetical protein